MAPAKMFRLFVYSAFFPLLTLTLSVALSACQSKTVSVAEARKITASFQGKGFVAPPRTIRDITAILDQQGAVDTERRRKLKAKAGATPPDTENPADQARFYYYRGRAAEKLGRSTKALKDFRRAVRFLEKADKKKSGLGYRKSKPFMIGRNIRRKLFQKLAFVESKAGYFQDAIRHMKLSMKVKETPIAYRAMVRLYADAGDFKQAEQMKDWAIQFVDGKTEKIARGGGPGKEKQIWMGINIELINATLFKARGQWREAGEELKKVIRTYQKEFGDSKGYTFIPLKKAALADVLRKQGRLVEAEVMGREALLKALSTLGRNNPITADAARRLALVLHAQGRYDDAEKLTRATLDIFAKIGIPPGTRTVSLSRRFLGTILLSKGDAKGAIGEYDAARAAIKDNPELLRRLFANYSSYDLALLQVGRTDEALKRLKLSLKNAVKRYGEANFNTATVGGLLAMAQAKAGDREAALKGFLAITPVLLDRSRQSDGGNAAGGAVERRLTIILESYIGLLADIRGTALERQAGIDTAAAAFRIAEIARSRSVQRALASSGARAAAKTPELADLVRREQDAKKQLSVMFATLADVLSAPTSQQDANAVASLRRRIDSLGAAHTSIMAEINKSFPEYAELINPKPSTLNQVRENLNPDEALIATYSGRRRTYVWAIDAAGATAFAAAELGREDLTDMVGMIRSAVEPEGGTLADLPEFDLATAYELYSDILEPVKAGWGNSKSLLIVAHGPLGWLPFSLLPTRPVKLEARTFGPFFTEYRKVPWLVRTHAVTVLPSVSSLKTLRVMPPGDPSRRPFAGFGDPYFNARQAAEAARQKAAGKTVLVSIRATPNTTGLASAKLADLPRLPDTAAEVKSIAAALRADPKISLFLGAAANEKTVKSTDLTKYKVLAFATHGLVPGDLDGLTQPALAMSAPDVAGVKGDGLLTMEEILGLRLDADWVVLSACNTASGDGAGAEAVSGLGLAFFYAGTRALLVSNWPVESASAKLLTTDLFRRQANNGAISRAEALRQSMIALIDGPGYKDPKTGKEIFVYAHPLFWAPFSLIGDGGGGKTTS